MNYTTVCIESDRSFQQCEPDLLYCGEMPLIKDMSCQLALLQHWAHFPQKSVIWYHYEEDELIISTMRAMRQTECVFVGGYVLVRHSSAAQECRERRCENRIYLMPALLCLRIIHLKCQTAATGMFNQMFSLVSLSCTKPLTHLRENIYRLSESNKRRHQIKEMFWLWKTLLFTWVCVFERNTAVWLFLFLN